jgi:hypothetical protein
MKAIIIDLYTGEADVLPEDEIKEATRGLKKIKTEAATTWKAEEYIVVVTY